jgi:hypothetical protein
VHMRPLEFLGVSPWIIVLNKPSRFSLPSEERRHAFCVPLLPMDEETVATTSDVCWTVLRLSLDYAERRQN